MYYSFSVYTTFPHLGIAASVSFTELSYEVDEGEGLVEVCIILTGQTARNANVVLQTFAGTATLGMQTCEVEVHSSTSHCCNYMKVIASVTGLDLPDV